MRPTNRLLRRIEIGGWILVAILIFAVYLRIFTPLGGDFPERTRGPMAFWKSEFHTLGDLSEEDELRIPEILPTHRIFE